MYSGSWFTLPYNMLSTPSYWNTMNSKKEDKLLLTANNHRQPREIHNPHSVRDYGERITEKYLILKFVFYKIQNGYLFCYLGEDEMLHYLNIFCTKIELFKWNIFFKNSYSMFVFWVFHKI